MVVGEHDVRINDGEDLILLEESIVHSKYDVAILILEKSWNKLICKIQPANPNNKYKLLVRGKWQNKAWIFKILIIEFGKSEKKEN